MAGGRCCSSTSPIWWPGMARVWDVDHVEECAAREPGFRIRRVAWFPGRQPTCMMRNSSWDRAGGQEVPCRVRRRRLRRDGQMSRSNQYGLKYRDENRQDVHSSYEPPSFTENRAAGGQLGILRSRSIQPSGACLRRERECGVRGVAHLAAADGADWSAREREFTIDLTKLRCPVEKRR